MRYAIEEVQDLGNKLLRRLERIQGYDKLYDAIDTIVSSPREIGGDSAELTVISNTNVPEDIEGDVEAFYKAAEEVATQNGYYQNGTWICGRLQRSSLHCLLLFSFSSFLLLCSQPFLTCTNSSTSICRQPRSSNHLFFGIFLHV